MTDKFRIGDLVWLRYYDPTGETIGGIPVSRTAYKPVVVSGVSAGKKLTKTQKEKYGYEGENFYGAYDLRRKWNIIEFIEDGQSKAFILDDHHNEIHRGVHKALLTNAEYQKFVSRKK